MSILRSASLLEVNCFILEKTMRLPVNSTQFELQISAKPSHKSNFGIRFFSGAGHEMELCYDNESHALCLDRSKTRNNSFNQIYEKLGSCETNLVLDNDSLNLRIFVDNSIVEVFANRGKAVMTMQVFPGKEDSGIELFCNRGNIFIEHLALWPIKNSWEIC